MNITTTTLIPSTINTTEFYSTIVDSNKDENNVDWLDPTSYELMQYVIVGGGILLLLILIVGILIYYFYCNKPKNKLQQHITDSNQKKSEGFMNEHTAIQFSSIKFVE